MSEVHLIQTWFDTTHEARKREYEKCLNINAQNPFIDRIFLLYEGPHTREQWPDEKIEVVKMDHRPTFGDAFAVANLFAADENTVSIVANTDIYIQPQEIKKIDARLVDKKTVLALTRHDVDLLGRTHLFNCAAGNSQDTWAWRGSMRADGSIVGLGRHGCDNRIAYEFQRAGYDVINPSKTIRTHHIHHCGFRVINREMTVPEPYLFVPPTE